MRTRSGGEGRWGVPATRWGLCLGLLAARADAASWTGYLTLDGFRGETTLPVAPGGIVVQGFTESLGGSSNTVRVASTRASLLAFAPLQVEGFVEQTSPALALALAQGSDIPNAQLKLVQASRAQTEMLALNMTGVKVVALTVEGRSGTNPKQKMSLSFGGLTINSVVVKRAAPVAALARTPSTWDVLGEPVGGTRAFALAGTPFTTEELEAQGWFGNNLLVNSGAEANAGVWNDGRNVPPLGWVASGGFGAVGYEGWHGSAGSADHGRNLFVIAPGESGGAGTQVVDLEAVAAEIDAGRLQAVLSGWLGGSTSESEAAKLMALFRNATGETTGSVEFSSTEAGAGADSEPGALVRQEQEVLVPAGTRVAEVTLELRRQTLSATGGVGDDLSLVLERVTTASPDLPVSIQYLRAVGTSEQSRVQLSWSPRAEGVVVESSASVDGPWRRETVVTLQDQGREHFAVPASDLAESKFWRVRAASTRNLR